MKRNKRRKSLPNPLKIEEVFEPDLERTDTFILKVLT